MSEYWVSRKKYWCKYCEIYIADDAPSRNQHENGLRHKGNKERFVKSLYKQGERRKKDLDDEKRELARIEQAANAAFANDVSAGRATASSSKSTPQPSSSSSRKPPPKATSAFADYSTAQSLGYTDPDEEKRELRRQEGVVGQWEIVAPPPPPLPAQQEPLEGEEDVKPGVADATNADQPPGAQGTTAEPNNEEDTRHFKIRKRKLDLGLDDLWDPGDIPIKLKAPKTDALEEPAPANGVLSVSSTSGTDTHQQQSLDDAPDRPKWISKGWKQVTQLEAETESAVAPLSHIEEQHGLGESDADNNNVGPTTKVTVESTTSITTGDSHPGGTVQPPLSASMHHGHEVDIDVKPKVKEEEASTQLMAPTALFRKRKIPAKR